MELMGLMEACFKVYKKGNLNEMRVRLDKICETIYPNCDIYLKNSVFEYFSAIRETDFFEKCIRQNVKQWQKGKSQWQKFKIIKND